MAACSTPSAPSNNALSVLNTSRLSPAGTYTTTSVTAANPMAPSDTLVGASAIAVSQNDESVYVAGESSGTLTVFERNLSTNVLTWVQTLQDGVNGCAWPGRRHRRCGSWTTASMSTSPAARTARWPSMASNPTVRWCSTRSWGASRASWEPSALAVEPANGNVYVASQAGLDSGAGDWPPSRQPRPRRRIPSP